MFTSLMELLMNCDVYSVIYRYLIVKEDGTLVNYGLNAGEC